MKKLQYFVLFISAGLLLASCGLLFTTSETKSVNPLALSDGGYLSTDEFNEITPFVFRDTNGIAYLFFSSDRAGSYDIYYSIMNTDGTFEQPVMMTNLINGANSDEIYPVVYIESPFYKIAFLSISSNTTNLFAVRTSVSLLKDYELIGKNILTNITGLGLIENESGAFPLMTINKSSTINFMILDPDGFVVNQSTNLLTSCYSANGFAIPVQNGYSDVFIKTVKTGIKFQLAAEMLSKTSITLTQTLPPFIVTNITNISTLIPTTVSVDAYLSKFNDISPFVDTKDDYKVYFASDRYSGDSHKGDYDLYRYNVTTFFNLPSTAGILPADKTKPTVTYVGISDMDSIGDTYIYFHISTSDNFCTPPYIKLYFGFDGTNFSEIPYSDYNNYYPSAWYYYFSFPSMGMYSFYSYAVDWFGNVSLTNKITLMNTAP
jgi:hypothetical protein